MGQWFYQQPLGFQKHTARLIATCYVHWHEFCCTADMKIMPLNIYLRPLRNTAIAISLSLMPIDIAADINGVSAIDNVCLWEARRAEDQHGFP